MKDSSANVRIPKYLKSLIIYSFFATLTSELAIFYLYLGGISRPESVFVCVAIVLSISVTYGYVARDPQVAAYISAISSLVILFFAFRLFYPIPFMSELGSSFAWAEITGSNIVMSWLSSRVAKTICTYLISKKEAVKKSSPNLIFLTVLFMIATVVLFAGNIVFGTYHIVRGFVFFIDEHEGLVGLAGIVLSFLAGVYFERKRRK